MTIIVVKTVINFLFIKYSYIFRISEPVEVPEVFYGPFDFALRLRSGTLLFTNISNTLMFLRTLRLRPSTALRNHSGTAQGTLRDPFIYLYSNLYGLNSRPVSLKNFEKNS